eukprot:IDg16312t1
METAASVRSEAFEGGERECASSAASYAACKYKHARVVKFVPLCFAARRAAASGGADRRAIVTYFEAIPSVVTLQQCACKMHDVLRTLCAGAGVTRSLELLDQVRNANNPLLQMFTGKSAL